jgi:23S rRNA-intervening sequence protein
MEKIGTPMGFEDLAVFKLAYRLSLEIHRASLSFPAVEQYALGDQLRRASKSICANLAEGFGKQGVAGRVQAVPDDGDRFGRRDAGVATLWPGSRLRRSTDLAAMA